MKGASKSLEASATERCGRRLLLLMSPVMLFVDGVKRLDNSSSGINLFAHADFEKQIASKVSASLLPFVICDHAVFHLVDLISYEDQVMRNRWRVATTTVAESRTKLETAQ